HSGGSSAFQYSQTDTPAKPSPAKRHTADSAFHLENPLRRGFGSDMAQSHKQVQGVDGVALRWRRARRPKIIANATSTGAATPKYRYHDGRRCHTTPTGSGNPKADSVISSSPGSQVGSARSKSCSYWVTEIPLKGGAYSVLHTDRFGIGYFAVRSLISFS